MKLLSILAASLFILASQGVAQLIDPTTGDSFVYKAQLVEVAPIIDGFLNDPSWLDAQAAALNQDVINVQRWTVRDDFDAAFAAAWRNGTLYIALQLRDDQLETDHPKVSRQDHIVLYLDPENGGHKSDLYRYLIPVGRNASVSDDSRLIVAWSGDGSSCELSFNLGHLLVKNQAISFGIFYNDVDDGRLNNRVGWGPIDYSEQDDRLPELVFSAKLKHTENQKTTQWGSIKTLY